MSIPCVADTTTTSSASSSSSSLTSSLETKEAATATVDTSTSTNNVVVVSESSSSCSGEGPTRPRCECVKCRRSPVECPWSKRKFAVRLQESLDAKQGVVTFRFAWVIGYNAFRKLIIDYFGRWPNGTINWTAFQSTQADPKFDVLVEFFDKQFKVNQKTKLDPFWNKLYRPIGDISPVSYCCLEDILSDLDEYTERKLSPKRKKTGV